GGGAPPLRTAKAALVLAVVAVPAITGEPNDGGGGGANGRLREAGPRCLCCCCERNPVDLLPAVLLLLLLLLLFEEAETGGYRCGDTGDGPPNLLDALSNFLSSTPRGSTRVSEGKPRAHVWGLRGLFKSWRA
ncbi:unnamed protein product, partial [Ectocarpus fasciculatus]